MVAESVVRDDFEEIDLDAMTFAELLLEQATVKAELVRIEAQLADPTRIAKLGAHEYRIWRRNALLAHAHFKRERLDIHALLQIKGPEARQARQAATRERVQADLREAAERKARRQAHWDALSPDDQAKKVAEQEERRALRAAGPAAHQAMMEEHARKRAAVLEAAREEGSLDGLILRLALVIRHVMGDGDGLPATVTDEDRAALQQMNEYLRATYGKAAVKAFLRGDLDGDS